MSAIEGRLATELGFGLRELATTSGLSDWTLGEVTFWRRLASFFKSPTPLLRNIKSRVSR
jgi:hypothetical protein